MLARGRDESTDAPIAEALVLRSGKRVIAFAAKRWSALAAADRPSVANAIMRRGHCQNMDAIIGRYVGGRDLARPQGPANAGDGVRPCAVVLALLSCGDTGSTMQYDVNGARTWLDQPW